MIVYQFVFCIVHDDIVHVHVSHLCHISHEVSSVLSCNGIELCLWLRIWVLLLWYNSRCSVMNFDVLLKMSCPWPHRTRCLVTPLFSWVYQRQCILNRKKKSLLQSTNTMSSLTLVPRQDWWCSRLLCSSVVSYLKILYTLSPADMGW